MLNDLKIMLLKDCQEYIPELAELWFNEISQHWVPNASIERATQNLIKHCNTNTMPMTFVAIYQNQAVGMASLRENDGIPSDLTPWLGSLVVHPHYRNKKIGEALIETIKHQAKQLNYTKLYLLAFDRTIPKWYEKLGWKIIGNDSLFSHPITLMETQLTSV